MLPFECSTKDDAWNPDYGGAAISDKLPTPRKGDDWIGRNSTIDDISDGTHNAQEDFKYRLKSELGLVRIEDLRYATEEEIDSMIKLLNLSLGERLHFRRILQDLGKLPPVWSPRANGSNHAKLQFNNLEEDTDHDLLDTAYAGSDIQRDLFHESADNFHPLAKETSFRSTFVGKGTPFASSPLPPH